MALPNSRDKTFTAGVDIVNPALVAAWEDWARAIHEGRFEGSSARQRTLYAGDGYYGLNTQNTDPLATNDGGGNGYFAWPLIFDVGDVLTDYSLWCNPNAVGSLTLGVYTFNLSTGVETLLWGANNTGTSYAEDCQITGKTDLVVEGTAMFLRVDSTSVNDQWGVATVKYQRPPRTT